MTPSGVYKTLPPTGLFFWCLQDSRVVPTRKKVLFMNARRVDMLNGNIVVNMIAFTIPVILTNLLALLYNAADLVVVGNFASPAAFAAVGATGALTNLFVTLFVGISTGGCICVAQYYGAHDGKNVSQTVHTCVLMSILGGLALAVIGCVFCKPVLLMMGTPEEIVDMSTRYMRIMFVCQPFNILYNFISGILRATGDTKRPFVIMAFTGALNVVLNLVFVIVFHMDVDGVGYATLIGGVVNCVIGGRILLNSDDSIRVNIKELHIYRDKLVKVLAYGIPSGLQGALFSLSNVIIQSAVNTLSVVGVNIGGHIVSGVSVVGGNSASSGIEGFIYMAMNSVSQAGLNFAGANYGARQYKRVDRTLLSGIGIVFVTGVVMCGGALLFRVPLLRLYQPIDADAVLYGMQRGNVIFCTYMLCGMYEVLSNSLRGIGSSWTPMIVSVVTVGLVRIMWVLFVFPRFLTPFMLYISWPLTWIASIVLLTIAYQTMKKRLFAKNEAQYAKAS